MEGYGDEGFIALFAAGFFFSWQRFATDDSSAIKNLPQTLRPREVCFPVYLNLAATISATSSTLTCSPSAFAASVSNTMQKGLAHSINM